MGTESEPIFLLDRKWPFRIAIGLWLGAAVGAWFLADAVERPAQVILAGLWVVGLGLLLRQFLSSLVGPVLAYDVLRVGRKPRQIWFRLAYAILLAILFAWVYFSWYAMAQYRGGGRVMPKDLSRLAETFFSVYMVVQFILVCILTPASVAGAIADEKERRTLEFLLATDLRDREILFGKLASRVGSLLLFLMAGLPILGLMQFFGGIDPDLVLAGFAATIATVLTLAALGIAASVLSRKARDAIALTYLLSIAYVLLSLVIYALAFAPIVRDSLQGEIFGYTITSEDLAYPAVCGNPFFMVVHVMERRSSLAVDLFGTLRHYLTFHAIVIAILVTWAGFKLRPIALRQTFGSRRRSIFARRKPAQTERPGEPARPRRALVTTGRPEIGEHPVLWKEVFVDAGLKLGGFGRVIVLGLVVCSFVPALFVFWFTVIDPGNSSRSGGPWWAAARWEDFGQGMNIYLRSAGTAATSLVCLAVAIRGSGVISGERDRHTLDALLTTPLSATTIVWGKWWGCILGMRWAWAWLFALWVMTLAAGGVHPVMFPAAVVSLAVYASAFAWIGVFCSLHWSSTLRSTMAAIVLSVFLAGGYFLVFAFCCVLPRSFAGAPDVSMDLMGNVLCGLSPPVCIGWLPVHEFHERELSLFSRGFPFAPFWVIGLVAWGGLSFALSRKCVAKFRILANRGPIEPERPRNMEYSPTFAPDGKLRKLEHDRAKRGGPPPLPKRLPPNEPSP